MIDWPPIVAALATGGLITGFAALLRIPAERKRVKADTALALTQAAEGLIRPLQERIEKQEQRIAFLERELSDKQAAVIKRDAQVAALVSELAAANVRLDLLETEVRRLGGDPHDIGGAA